MASITALFEKDLCGHFSNALACAAQGCFWAISRGFSAPGKMGISLPAAWHKALAISARFSGSPVTVVIPSNSHSG
jgi:hypothetical protein